MASLTRRLAVKGMVVGSQGSSWQERFGGRRKWNNFDYECPLLVLDMYEHAYHGLWCGRSQLRRRF